MSRRQFHYGIASARRLLGPPIIWAVHFSALYAAETVFCSWAGIPIHLVFIVVVTAAAAAGLLSLMTPLRAAAAGQATDFAERTGFALAVLGIIAVLWTAIPAVVLPSCTAPL